MPTWLRIVLAVVVGAHGIGHILFLMPVVSNTSWGQATQSWLLGGGGLARTAGAILWLVSLLGFLAAAWGIFRQAEWWPVVAMALAGVSILGLLLFWTRPVTSPVLSALFFNILLLTVLLVWRWPAGLRFSS